MQELFSLILMHASNSAWNAVMWIRIDCMRIRIHNIWRMLIRIQVNKNTKLILKVRKKNYSNLYLNLIISYFFKFRLEKYNFLRQKRKNQTLCLVNFAFPLISYLWIRIRIHDPKWIRSRPDPDPHHCWNEYYYLGELNRWLVERTTPVSSSYSSNIKAQ